MIWILGFLHLLIFGVCEHTSMFATSEDYYYEWFSFQHVSCRDGTQVLRLGSKPYLMKPSHWFGFIVVLFCLWQGLITKYPCCSGVHILAAVMTSENKLVRFPVYQIISSVCLQNKTLMNCPKRENKVVQNGFKTMAILLRYLECNYRFTSSWSVRGYLWRPLYKV